jgi:hypothetical protein
LKTDLNTSVNLMMRDYSEKESDNNG